MCNAKGLGDDARGTNATPTPTHTFTPIDHSHNHTLPRFSPSVTHSERNCRLCNLFRRATQLHIRGTYSDGFSIADLPYLFKGK